MVPGAIRELLGIHALADPELNEYFVKELAAEGLIEPNWVDPGSRRQYKTTERGEAMVRFLCETPLPVQVWIDPRGGDGK